MIILILKKSDYSYIAGEKIQINEKRINTLIQKEMEKIITELKKIEPPFDVGISSACTFQSPDILNIYYSIWSDEFPEDKTIDAYFTANIDITSKKMISLQDIIEPKQLARIVVNLEFSDNEYDPNYGIFFFKHKKNWNRHFHKLIK